MSRIVVNSLSLIPGGICLYTSLDRPLTTQKLYINFPWYGPWMSFQGPSQSHGHDPGPWCKVALVVILED